MIIGLTGLCEDSKGNIRIAGAGKDAVADRLVEKHGFVRIALADPLKRICQDVFDFTDEQLWGPSSARNAPDQRYCHTRYLKQDGGEYVDTYVSPRMALQTLGTEWGRALYGDVWIDYLLRVAKKLDGGGYYYDARSGLRPWVSRDAIQAKTNVVVSDLRFFNEREAIRKVGGKVVRVRRRVDEEFKDTRLDCGHQSETELVSLVDESFDAVIENFGTLDTLALLADRAVDQLKGKILPFDEKQVDVPPFLRKREGEGAA